jgi:putative membrane protein
MKLSSIHLLLRLLIIIYAVGIIGILTPLKQYIIPLTVYNLLLTFVCFLLGSGKLNGSRLFDILLIGVFGFAVEYAGVHTGYLFGNYRYGVSLGTKIQAVPVIMSLNWILLCFCSCAVVWNVSKNNIVRAVLAAALMTGLDFLIERVAAQMGFWYWRNNEVPVFNYVCWFGLSFAANYWISQRKSVVRNQVTVGIFVIQVVFFGILCLFL